MAELTRQLVGVAGTVVTFAAADAAGDTFKGRETGVLRVRNGGAAAVTATLVVPGNTAYGQPQPDVALSIPAGGEGDFTGFDAGTRDDLGFTKVTYSSAASVTVAYVEA